MPQISIIVPVYNVEHYIQRCVDSILMQTFTDFEVILVDDGSTDNCGSICDEYALKDLRIHSIHQDNGGPSAARNTGINWTIERSDSEWIGFIDADDWIHEVYLDQLISAVQAFSADIGVCGIRKTTGINDGDNLLVEERYAITSHELYYYYAKNIVNVSSCGKLFRKKCFQNVRFPVGKQWEDLATMYKVILSVPKCAVVSAKLYYYYINEKGIVRRPWNPSRMDEFDAYEEQLAFFSLYEEYRDIYEELQGTYIRAISYSYFMEQESNIPTDEKKYYAKILQKKIRTALKKYRKTAGIRFQVDKSVFDTAFPRLMQLYWISLNCIGGLRRN